jgi:hypothetical protein
MKRLSTMPSPSVRIRQFICGLSGHIVFAHYEPTKLSLKCGLCEKQTGGWEIAASNPKPKPLIRIVSSYGRRRA